MPRAKKHHNNKGYRQIKTGRTADALQRLAEKMKVPFKIGKASSSAAPTGELAPKRKLN